MNLRVERRVVSDEAVGRLGAGLHPILRRVYAARGVQDEAELSLALSRLLPVSTLENVDAAVGLLLAHREAGRRILVVGDFDADGATSSALLVRALRAWGSPTSTSSCRTGSSSATGSRPASSRSPPRVRRR